MGQWNYWKHMKHYQEELRERALGNLPEMEAAKHLTELVSRDYSIGEEILDVGCGTGHFILSLREHLPDLHYTGVDLTWENILNARTIFPDHNYRFLEGDARRLPFLDNQFDISICSNTLPHIPNPLQAVRELIRVTRRRVLIRMLVGHETMITKKALNNEFDEQGEPVSFMYVNIFSEQLIRETVQQLSSDCAVRFHDDLFDQHKIQQHFERHKHTAGESIATRIVDGVQFKGYLLLPWKVLDVTTKAIDGIHLLALLLMQLVQWGLLQDSLALAH